MNKKVVSGTISLSLLAAVLVLAFDTKLSWATGTVYIRPDGLIDPPTAPIQQVGDVYYTLTGDIHDSLRIERNNIVLDGAGYTLRGNGAQGSIGLSLAYNVTVRNTQVRGFWYGIDGVMVGDCVIANNSITNNMIGVHFYYFSVGNIITGNHIADNNNTGIDLSLDADGNTIVNNKIVNNVAYGISVGSHSDNCIITQNIIANNPGGILLSLYSTHTSVHHNNILWNLYQAFDRGSSNYWDDDYPSGGNYWSDYTGSDENSDGIGDTPYAIDVNSQDRYPLMQPHGVQHDVAALNITMKTAIGENTSPHMRVRIANYGAATENCDVSLTADGSQIGVVSGITLTGAGQAYVDFTWNTAGFARGKYLIMAEVAAVPGETAVEDNTLALGWVYISIVGDITGSSGEPDGKVDIRDIAIVAKAFGSYPGHERWNLNADINDDDKVDIKDIAIVAKNYGSTT